MGVFSNFACSKSCVSQTICCKDARTIIYKLLHPANVGFSIWRDTYLGGQNIWTARHDQHVQAQSRKSWRYTTQRRRRPCIFCNRRTMAFVSTICIAATRAFTIRVTRSSIWSSTRQRKRDAWGATDMKVRLSRSPHNWTSRMTIGRATRA